MQIEISPDLALLSAGFAVDGKTLIGGVTHAFVAGEVCAVLGPNGAGKSTLLGMLGATLKPSSGTAWLNGAELHAQPGAELARQRAVLLQESSVAFDYSVADVVGLGRYPHRLQPAKDEAQIAQSAMHACNVDAFSDRILNTLSGGEKARAQMARVLAQIWHDLGKPRWLLLDEPTAALDMAHQQAMLDVVRKWAKLQNFGVVLVMHDLNLALRYTDACLVLSAGAVVARGATADVLQPPLIARVWQVDSERSTNSRGQACLLF